MLGLQPLSVAPLSAIEGSELVTFSQVDIYLHPIPEGNDICLFDPTEVEDCTNPPVCCGINGNGGGGITLIPERKKKSERSKKLAEAKALKERQEKDDLESVMAILAFLGHQPYCDSKGSGTKVTFIIS
jgi:hypothetical protein